MYYGKRIMPRLSSIPIETKRMGYFISNLWNTFTLIENREEAVIFLKELLTPTEVRMLAKRIQIAKMLLEGYKYEDIQTHVRVTSPTITSVNNQLNFGDGGYLKIIERLVKMEQKKQENFEDKMSGKKRVLYPRPFGGVTDWAVEKVAKEITAHSKRKSIEKKLG